MFLCRKYYKCYFLCIYQCKYAILHILTVNCVVINNFDVLATFPTFSGALSPNLTFSPYLTKSHIFQFSHTSTNLVILSNFANFTQFHLISPNLTFAPNLTKSHIFSILTYFDESRHSEQICKFHLISPNLTCHAPNLRL